MLAQTVPSLLPAGYEEIWHVLKETEDRVESPRQLATELGMSAQTLRRMIIDGDVPDFFHEQSQRTYRIWASIIARLAARFECDPRAWIEQVGMEWNTEIEAIVVGAYDWRGGDDLDSIDASTSAEAQPDAAAWPETLGIGLASFAPLTEGSETQFPSFLEQFARRIVKMVNPHPRAAASSYDDIALLEALQNRGSHVHLGVGLMDSKARQSLDLTQIPIPGLRIAMTTFLAIPRENAASVPDWKQLLSDPAVRFLVPEGGVAQSHLSDDCGVSEERIIPVGEGAWHLKERYLDLLRTGSVGSLALFGDLDSLRTVASALEEDGELRERFVMSEVETESHPRYPITLFLGSALSHWGDDFRQALHGELFGNMLSETARLYADLAADSDLRCLRSSLHDLRAATPGWQLVSFPEADIVFQDAFNRRLLTVLAEGIIEHHGGLAAADSTLRVRAANWAVARSRLLSPIEWRDSLNACVKLVEVFPERWLTPALPTKDRSFDPEMARWMPNCLSCNADLTEPDLRRASEHYCHHCADENDVLRSENEVRELLANRMQLGDRRLPMEEARRRASVYMRAMPAWSTARV